MSSSFCGKVAHDLQKIKYLCIDPLCVNTEKLGCADCFLEHHAVHQKVHTEDFINQASLKISELKSQHCFSVFKTIQDLHETIDVEFENCAGAILQRFENVRKQIKSSVDQEALGLQRKQEEINISIEQQASQIGDLLSKSMLDLGDEEIAQMTKLYHELPSLQSWHCSQLDQLRQEKDTIKQKKQKHLKKLNQVVNTLLREFGDKFSPEKETEYEESLGTLVTATPEKKNVNFNILQNSQTKSPPSQIVEGVRRGKKGPAQKNTKVQRRKKLLSIDE